MKIQQLLFLLSLIVVCGVWGCSSPVSTRKVEFYNPLSVNRPHRAARMTGLWEAKQLTKKSGSIRGFQGEIIFFRDERMEKSTAVDGTLTVYLFNVDKNADIDGVQPEREYTFDSDRLRKSVEKNKRSKLISYGLWLPYDQAPGDERNFVILAKFEGKEEDGELVCSDQTPIQLPGRPVAKSEKNNSQTTKRLDAQQVNGAVSGNGFDDFNAIRHADYNDATDFSGVQLTAYDEAVQRLQAGANAAELSRSSDKLALPPSVSRQIFQTPRHSGVEKIENSLPIDSEKTPAIGFGGGDGGSDTAERNAERNSVPDNQRFAAIGFGNGNEALNVANNQAATSNASYRSSIPEEMSPERLTRFRPNFTGIGSQIDRRMQDYANRQQPYGVADASNANFHNDEIQQASYVASNPQLSASQASKQQEMHQAMVRMMAEQEQRRNLNQASPLGFSNYNAATFPNDQSRVTVSDRYPSWGIAPSQTGQQINQFPLYQTPNTSQPSPYIESDWGAAFDNQPPTRETQVLYSPVRGSQSYP
ncbi:MAG: hypothetical protein LBJ67_18985 [Planctomycetaceae bacterium]|nr:hypothetical protein [Planctomycetaceae bacterium]